MGMLAFKKVEMSKNKKKSSETLDQWEKLVFSAWKEGKVLTVLDKNSNSNDQNPSYLEGLYPSPQMLGQLDLDAAFVLS